MADGMLEPNHAKLLQNVTDEGGIADTKTALNGVPDGTASNALAAGHIKTADYGKSVKVTPAGTAALAAHNAALSGGTPNAALGQTSPSATAGPLSEGHKFLLNHIHTMGGSATGDNLSPHFYAGKKFTIGDLAAAQNAGHLTTNDEVGDGYNPSHVLTPAGLAAIGKVPAEPTPTQSALGVAAPAPYAPIAYTPPPAMPGTAVPYAAPLTLPSGTVAHSKVKNALSALNMHGPLNPATAAQVVRGYAPSLFGENSMANTLGALHTEGMTAPDESGTHYLTSTGIGALQQHGAITPGAGVWKPSGATLPNGESQGGNPMGLGAHELSTNGALHEEGTVLGQMAYHHAALAQNAHNAVVGQYGEGGIAKKALALDAKLTGHLADLKKVVGQLHTKFSNGKHLGQPKGITEKDIAQFKDESDHYKAVHKALTEAGKSGSGIHALAAHGKPLTGNQAESLPDGWQKMTSTEGYAAKEGAKLANVKKVGAAFKVATKEGGAAQPVIHPEEFTTHGEAMAHANTLLGKKPKGQPKAEASKEPAAPGIVDINKGSGKSDDEPPAQPPLTEHPGAKKNWEASDLKDFQRAGFEAKGSTGKHLILKRSGGNGHVTVMPNGDGTYDVVPAAGMGSSLTLKSVKSAIEHSKEVMANATTGNIKEVLDTAAQMKAEPEKPSLVDHEGAKKHWSPGELKSFEKKGYTTTAPGGKLLAKTSADGSKKVVVGTSPDGYEVWPTGYTKATDKRHFDALPEAQAHAEALLKDEKASANADPWNDLKDLGASIVEAHGGVGKKATLKHPDGSLSKLVDNPNKPGHYKVFPHIKSKYVPHLSYKTTSLPDAVAKVKAYHDAGGFADTSKHLGLLSTMQTGSTAPSGASKPPTPAASDEPPDGWAANEYGNPSKHDTGGVSHIVKLNKNTNTWTAKSDDGSYDRTGFSDAASAYAHAEKMIAAKPAPPDGWNKSGEQFAKTDAAGGNHTVSHIYGSAGKYQADGPGYSQSFPSQTQAFAHGEQKASEAVNPFSKAQFAPNEPTNEEKLKAAGYFKTMSGSYLKQANGQSHSISPDPLFGEYKAKGSGLINGPHSGGHGYGSLEEAIDAGRKHLGTTPAATDQNGVTNLPPGWKQGTTKGHYENDRGTHFVFQNADKQWQAHTLNHASVHATVQEALDAAHAGELAEGNDDATQHAKEKLEQAGYDAQTHAPDGETGKHWHVKSDSPHEHYINAQPDEDGDHKHLDYTHGSEVDNHWAHDIDYAIQKGQDHLESPDPEGEETEEDYDPYQEKHDEAKEALENAGYVPSLFHTAHGTDANLYKKEAGSKTHFIDAKPDYDGDFEAHQYDGNRMVDHNYHPTIEDALEEGRAHLHGGDEEETPEQKLAAAGYDKTSFQTEYGANANNYAKAVGDKTHIIDAEPSQGEFNAHRYNNGGFEGNLFHPTIEDAIEEGKQHLAGKVRAAGDLQPEDKLAAAGYVPSSDSTAYGEDNQLYKKTVGNKDHYIDAQPDNDGTFLGQKYENNTYQDNEWHPSIEKAIDDGKDHLAAGAESPDAIKAKLDAAGYKAQPSVNGEEYYQKVAGSNAHTVYPKKNLSGQYDAFSADNDANTLTPSSHDSIDEAIAAGKTHIEGNAAPAATGTAQSNYPPSMAGKLAGFDGWGVNASGEHVKNDDQGDEHAVKSKNGQWQTDGIGTDGGYSGSYATPNAAFGAAEKNIADKNAEVAAPAPWKMPSQELSEAKGGMLADPTQTALFDGKGQGISVTGNTLHGVPFEEPADPDYYKTHQDIPEPALPASVKKSGIVMQEPDGRVWVVEPTNHFGGYQHTFPKGDIEPGLSAQQNALKELLEETGLTAQITGHLGDFAGDGGTARYYLAKRTGGDPNGVVGMPLHHAGEGTGETQSLKLVPMDDAGKLLNKPKDKAILAALKTHSATAPASTPAAPSAAPVASPAPATAAPASGWEKGMAGNMYPYTNPTNGATIAKAATGKKWVLHHPNQATDTTHPTMKAALDKGKLLDAQTPEPKMKPGFFPSPRKSATGSATAPSAAPPPWGGGHVTINGQKFTHQDSDPVSEADVDSIAGQVKMSDAGKAALKEAVTNGKVPDMAALHQTVAMAKASTANQGKDNEFGKSSVAKALAYGNIVGMKEKAEQGDSVAQAAAKNLGDTSYQTNQEKAAVAKAEADKAFANSTAEDIMHTKTGGQGGSNEGGFYTTKSGHQVYAKVYKNPDQAHVEHAANAVYNALGIPAPQSVVKKAADGKTVYASQIIPNQGELGKVGITPDNAKQALKGFAADVLLSNWDAAGMTHDNMLVGHEGTVYRADNGGSLHFRAQGAEKTAEQLSRLDEFKTLAPGGKSPSFDKLFKAAGYHSPEEIPDLAGQLKKIVSLEASSGGWDGFLKTHAPDMPDALRAKAADILTKRTALLKDKLGSYSHLTPRNWNMMSSSEAQTHFGAKQGKISGSTAALNSHKSGNYSHQNAILRSKGGYASASAADKKKIDALDKLLAHPDYEVGKDLIVSRKVSSHHPDTAHYPSLNAGDVINDPGFVSTAVDPHIWHGNFHMMIHVPKEAHAAWDAAHSGVSNSGEKELTFPRDAKYRVISVDKPGEGETAPGWHWDSGAHRCVLEYIVPGVNDRSPMTKKKFDPNAVK